MFVVKSRESNLSTQHFNKSLTISIGEDVGYVVTYKHLATFTNRQVTQPTPNLSKSPLVSCTSFVPIQSKDLENASSRTPSLPSVGQVSSISTSWWSREHTRKERSNCWTMMQRVRHIPTHKIWTDKQRMTSVYSSLTRVWNLGLEVWMVTRLVPGRT